MPTNFAPKDELNLTQFGALRSVTFRGVGASGEDIYEVRLDHATTEWKLTTGPDGKMQSNSFRPL